MTGKVTTSKQAQSKFLAFVDECGDHSLTSIDRDFPLFLLSLVIIKRQAYVQRILPELNRFKLDYWDHEGINLHSRDIRKAEGPFTILQNGSRREQFMNDLTTLVSEWPYLLFIVGIRKDKLCERYHHAENPYRLALTFVMERVVRWMEETELSTLPIVAESRGKNEDNELKAAFFDLMNRGTDYVASKKFKRLSFPLQFHDKRKNIAGLQLADLCAHPSARRVLKANQSSRAFNVVKRHIHPREGWKIFPL
jgi:hypothetical protein